MLDFRDHFESQTSIYPNFSGNYFQQVSLKDFDTENNVLNYYGLHKIEWVELYEKSFNLISQVDTITYSTTIDGENPWTFDLDKYKFYEKYPELIENNSDRVSGFGESGMLNDFSKFAVSVDGTRFVFVKNNTLYDETEIDTIIYEKTLNYLYINDLVNSNLDSLDLGLAKITTIKAADTNTMYIGVEKSIEVNKNWQNYLFIYQLNLNKRELIKVDSIAKDYQCEISFDVSKDNQFLAISYYGPSYYEEDYINGGYNEIKPRNCEGIFIKNLLTDESKSFSMKDLGFEDYNLIDVNFYSNNRIIFTSDDFKTFTILYSNSSFIEKFEQYSLPFFYHEDSGETLIANSNLENKISLCGHKYAIKGLRLTSDTTQLLTFSADNTIKLWNKNSRLCKTFIAENTEFIDVGSTEDGKRIWSLSADGLIVYYDIETEKPICYLKLLENGSYIVTTPNGYFDGTVTDFNNYLNFIKGTEMLNTENYFNQFYRPNLLKRILANENLSQ